MNGFGSLDGLGDICLYSLPFDHFIQVMSQIIQVLGGTFRLACAGKNLYHGLIDVSHGHCNLLDPEVRCRPPAIIWKVRCADS